MSTLLDTAMLLHAIADIQEDDVSDRIRANAIKYEQEALQS